MMSPSPPQVELSRACLICEEPTPCPEHTVAEQQRDLDATVLWPAR